MNAWTETVLPWLADFYILSTLVLIGVLAAMWLIRQPVQRIGVAWATMANLAALGIICALPYWPRIEWSAALAKVAPSHALSPVLDAESFLPYRRARDPSSAAAAVPPSTPLPAGTVDRSSVEPQAAASSATIAIPNRRPTIVLLLFLSGTVLVAGWLACGAVQAARLCRNASMASASLREQLNQLVSRSGRSPRLLVSPRIDRAVAMGIWRPTIVLPERFNTHESQQGRRAVLAHEWAHIHNRDLWLLAFGRCLLLILFAHPLYWWLRHQVRDDQEAIADAAAVGVSGTKEYADRLVSWAREQQNRPTLAQAAVLGIWEIRVDTSPDPS